MRLAGVEVRAGAAAQLACLLQPHNEGLAFHLGEAIDHLHEHFTLTARERDTILRVLAVECPPGLADLRAILLADRLGQVEATLA